MFILLRINTILILFYLKKNYRIILLAFTLTFIFVKFFFIFSTFFKSENDLFLNNLNNKKSFNVTNTSNSNYILKKYEDLYRIKNVSRSFPVESEKSESENPNGLKIITKPNNEQSSVFFEGGGNQNCND